MNIPSGLKQLREAYSCEAANKLLAEGWVLITATAALTPAREPNTYFLLGWVQQAEPVAAPIEQRRSGNLSHDARL